MYARLNQPIRQALASFAVNSTLLDIGGFDGTLGLELLTNYNAKAVTCLDKEHGTQLHHKNLSFITQRFHESTTATFKPFDKFILSWPINNSGVEPLINLLPKTGQLCYIGSNFNSTACGTPKLWEFLTSKAITSYENSEQNSCIIYDLSKPRTSNKVLLEECAGLDQSRIYIYEPGFASPSLCRKILGQDR